MKVYVFLLGWLGNFRKHEVKVDGLHYSASSFSISPKLDGSDEYITSIPNDWK